MTTLWIFGDNYSADWDKEMSQAPCNLKDVYKKIDPDPNNTWQKYVADELCLDIRNHAMGFASIEYMFQQFNECRKDIKTGDIIVITVISPDIATRNFVRDDPQILTADTDFTKIRFHNPERYISREDAFNLYLNNFLYNLKALTIDLNLKTIIIASQKNIHFFLNNNPTQYWPVRIANGCLQDINSNEYADEIKNEAYYFRDDAYIKTNWLTKSNRRILAEKIVNNIRNNTNINLEEGFIKGTINDTNRKDLAFLKEEY